MSFRDDFPIYCMLMDERILVLADEIRAARKEPKRGTQTQGPPKKQIVERVRRSLKRGLM